MSRDKLVGIKDIADRCGVSQATVSNVLNNKNNVGKQTRDKILKAARELGYVPKRTEDTVHKRKKNTVELTEKQKVNRLHIHHNFSNIL